MATVHLTVQALVGLCLLLQFVHHGLSFSLKWTQQDHHHAADMFKSSLLEKKRQRLFGDMYNHMKFNALREDPEVHMNVSEIIRYHGYPVETYTAPTLDGFLLGLQRIPHGRHGNTHKDLSPRPVVFLQHGLLCSSTNWVTNLPNESLGCTGAYTGLMTFDISMLRHAVNIYTGLAAMIQYRLTEKKIGDGHPGRFPKFGCFDVDSPTEKCGWAFLLADAGFDVWLGNTRGNTYSSRHKTLKPDQAAFWDWSWDEHASKDLPAMIDFALGVSRADSLYYVGHSQGTLIAFAQLSHDPVLSKKVKLFMALGPVITAGHAIGPVRVLSYLTPDLQDLFDIFGIYDFLPNNVIMDFLARTFCTYDTRFLCADILFLISGIDTSNLNQTRLPVYISHTPAGTSVRNMVHFSQMVRYGHFQKYDYGSPRKNEKKYGQPTPPMYNITNMRVPVVLFSGGKDWLADVEDVEHLSKALPNLVHHYRIPSWNHLDFIWGINAPSVVYNHIIDYIKKDVANNNATPKT